MAAVLVALLALFAALGVVPPAAAQQNALRIVAVVNDEVISAYDLEQRLRLVIGTAGAPNSPEQMRRLSAQVLRSMIDERLQLQEAKRLGITVSNEEIAEAIGRIERQNNLKPGSLPDVLKAEGLSYASLEAQARAALAWPKVVRRRAARLAVVSEDEVDEALARFRENADKPSHLVSQIFLAVDSPQDEGEVQANINRIAEQLRGGAPFTALAQQFSQDASAREGGNMGWVQVGQLPQELENVLVTMPVGSVSRPIRTAQGYHIVALRERREPRGAAAQADTSVALYQIFLPLADGAGGEDVASQKALAQTIAESVDGCADMDKAAKELASPLSGPMGTVRVGDLAADMRKIVTTLKVGEASAPIPVDGGLRVLMVCERDAPAAAADANLPSRLEIQRMIGEQKMELQSRRFLRDLRQTAFIDIRA